MVDPNIPPPSAGAKAPVKLPPGKVIYGEGLTFKGGSHATTLAMLPSEHARDIASRLPEVPKSPSNHFANFLLACQGREKTRSNFAVAGPLCQAMALGIIAQRVNADLAFDPATRRITNHRVANALLDGPPPVRSGNSSTVSKRTHRKPGTASAAGSIPSRTRTVARTFGT